MSSYKTDVPSVLVMGWNRNPGLSLLGETGSARCSNACDAQMYRCLSGLSLPTVAFMRHAHIPLLRTPCTYPFRLPCSHTRSIARLCPSPCARTLNRIRTPCAGLSAAVYVRSGWHPCALAESIRILRGSCLAAAGGMRLPVINMPYATFLPPVGASHIIGITPACQHLCGLSFHAAVLVAIKPCGLSCMVIVIKHINRAFIAALPM
jgi:hypothetical protein